MKWPPLFVGQGSFARNMGWHHAGTSSALRGSSFTSQLGCLHDVSSVHSNNTIKWAEDGGESGTQKTFEQYGYDIQQTAVLECTKM